MTAPLTNLKESNSTSLEDYQLLFLGGMTLFFATLEFLIPRPLPWIRIGVANIPIIFAILKLSNRSVFILLFIKVLGQGLISGTLFSYIFLFSFGGSSASVVSMFFYQKLLKERVSCVGLSLLGALSSNVVQLALAYFWLLGESSTLLFFPLIALGTVSGTILGVVSEKLLVYMKWIETYPKGEIIKTEQNKKTPLSPLFRFYTGILLLFIFLFIPHWEGKAFLIPLFFLLNKEVGKKLRCKNSLIFITVIVLTHALTPLGRVLFTVGSFSITEGALELGLDKAFTLTGLLQLSQYAISPNLKLPGRLGSIMGRVFTIYDSLMQGRGELQKREKGNFFLSWSEFLKDNWNSLPHMEKKEELSFVKPSNKLKLLFFVLLSLEVLLLIYFYLW